MSFGTSVQISDFSLAAVCCSGDGGQVIVSEPDVWFVQVLRRTQPDTNARITLVPIVVASEVSLRDFCNSGLLEASNALVEYRSTQTGGVEEQGVVAAFNLDWLLTKLPTPDAIKIDEGAELEVLRNQPRMLNEVRLYSRSDRTPLRKLRVLWS